MNFLLTKKVKIAWKPSLQDVRNAQTAINIHYLGETGGRLAGKLVAAYPDKESEAFLDAHHNLHKTHYLTVNMSLDDTGKWHLTFLEDS